MSEPQSDALTTSPQPPKIKWFRTESNCRHMDRQSIALPTELLNPNDKIIMAVSAGIEPAISCVTGRRVNRYTTRPNYVIVGGGFEPPTFGLLSRRATELLHPALILLMTPT